MSFAKRQPVVQPVLVRLVRPPATRDGPEARRRALEVCCLHVDGLRCEVFEQLGGRRETVMTSFRNDEELRRFVDEYVRLGADLGFELWAEGSARPEDATPQQLGEAMEVCKAGSADPAQIVRDLHEALFGTTSFGVRWHGVRVVALRAELPLEDTTQTVELARLLAHPSVCQLRSLALRWVVPALDDEHDSEAWMELEERQHAVGDTMAAALRDEGVRLPTLQHLWVQGEGQEGGFATLQSAFPKVRHLTLLGPSIDDRLHVAQAWEPTLTVLDVDLSEWSWGRLCAELPYNLFPVLRSLVVRFDGTPSRDLPEEFVAVARARGIDLGPVGTDIPQPGEVVFEELPQPQGTTSNTTTPSIWRGVLAWYDEVSAEVQPPSLPHALARWRRTPRIDRPEPLERIDDGLHLQLRAGDDVDMTYEIQQWEVEGYDSWVHATLPRGWWSMDRFFDGAP